MKCCASPTTSIGAEAPAPRTAATDALQAIVFGEIMKPLAKALGPAGDVVVGSIAQGLFLKSVR